MYFPGINTTFPHGDMLLEICQKLCEESKTDRSKVIPAILMSIIGFEAYLNDITEHLASGIEENDLNKFQLAQKLFPKFDKDKLQIKTKVEYFYFILKECVIEKGKYPFQDLWNLIDLRNKIVHSRPEKFVYDKNGKKIKNNSIEKILNQLIDRKILKIDQNNRFSSWIYTIQEKDVAFWAFETVIDCLQLLVEPIKESKHEGISKSYERSLRERFHMGK